MGMYSCGERVDEIIYKDFCYVNLIKVTNTNKNVLEKKQTNNNKTDIIKPFR